MGNKEKEENRAYQVPLDHLEIQELRVTRVSQDLLENQVLMERQVREVHLDHKVSRVSQDHQEYLVSWVLKDQEVFLVKKELKEIQDHLESLEKEDHLAYLGLLERKVIGEIQDQEEIKGQLVHQEDLEILDCL